MDRNEAKCQADLDAALAALKKSNRLLLESIMACDMRAAQKQVIRLRASRWRLAMAVRQFERAANG